MITVKPIETLSFHNVSFGYSDNNLLFENINFNFPLNQNTLIFGAHGTGKSALLKILTGLLEPVSGSYMLNNEVVNNLSFEEFNPIRMKIGYSFDYGGLINNRTLAENLILPLRYHNLLDHFDAAEKVSQYLELFGLRSVEDQRPSAVSGGARKATCVIRAFMMNPEMVLLDDPTTGLRDQHKEALKEVIKVQRQNGTLKHLFITSEDQKFVEQITDTGIEVKKHEITLYSTSKTIETKVAS